VAGQDSIQILCLFGGWGLAAGTAWFDDLSLEVLEEIKPASKTLTAQISIDPQSKNERFQNTSTASSSNTSVNASMAACGPKCSKTENSISLSPQKIASGEPPAPAPAFWPLHRGKLSAPKKISG
jgi:hypothetical protein